MTGGPQPPVGRRQALVGLALAAGLVAFNAAWVSARLGFLHKPRQVLESDHWHYIEMARGGPDARPELALRAPYCWRVLVPGLVRALTHAGLDLHLAFYLVTNACLVGFLCALFAYLGRLGFGLRTRCAGLALVGLMQGGVRWFEYQYWMTDPAGLLLVALGLLLVVDERPRLLGALSLLAAFVRETYVVVYPCYFVHELRAHGWRRALARTAAVAAAPGLAMLALRRAVVPVVDPPLLDSIADNLGFRFRHLFDNQPYLLTLGTWGVLLPLALLEPRRLLERARRRPEEVALVAVVYATTILISNNNERPLAYALPAVLPAALHGLERLMEAARPRALAALGAVIALQALFFVETRFTGLGISIYQPVSWPVVTAMLAFSLVALCLLRRPR